MKKLTTREIADILASRLKPGDKFNAHKASQLLEYDIQLQIVDPTYRTDYSDPDWREKSMKFSATVIRRVRAALSLMVKDRRAIRLHRDFFHFFGA